MSEQERCAAILGGIRHCPEPVAGRYRTKAASGSLHDFTLCAEHLVSWQQADQREKDEKAQKRAQADFVRQWRLDHHEEVYTAPVFCPLCNLALQSNAGGAYGLVEYHVAEHGEDYRAYLAHAARTAAQDDAGEG